VTRTPVRIWNYEALVVWLFAFKLALPFVSFRFLFCFIELTAVYNNPKPQVIEHKSKLGFLSARPAAVDAGK
jgi:hypothetical protein